MSHQPAPDPNCSKCQGCGRINAYFGDVDCNCVQPAPDPGKDSGGKTMLDKRHTGIYNKFIVTRTDGQSEPGQKHDGCRYFVLDATHDPHAPAALRAYANSCEGDYPLLAADVRTMAGKTNPIPEAVASLRKIARDILWEFTAQQSQRGGFGPEDVVRAEKQLEDALRASAPASPKQTAEISDAIAEHCAKYGDIGYYDQPLDVCVRQLVKDYDSLQAENAALRDNNQRVKAMFDDRAKELAVVQATPALTQNPDRLNAMKGALAYFNEGRCSGHQKYNGRYCRDVVGPDEWCINCAGLMLLRQVRQEATPASPQGWQPIETAPKNQLVLVFDGAINIGVSWENNGGANWVDEGGRMDPQPTHWQPLPSPPDADDPAPRTTP